jgi:hypothetical protein
MHSGSCLCGGIRFQIDAELPPVQLCHCAQCRKAQGSAFGANLPVDRAAFRLLCGAELLKAYESSPGKQRVFCSVCGSPIYSCRDQLPGVLRVRAGLIDGPLPAGVALHFHVASKADWWTISDALPQFPGPHGG